MKFAPINCELMKKYDKEIFFQTDNVQVNPNSQLYLS